MANLLDISQHPIAYGASVAVGVLLLWNRAYLRLVFLKATNSEKLRTEREERDVKGTDFEDKASLISKYAKINSLLSKSNTTFREFFTQLEEKNLLPKPKDQQSVKSSSGKPVEPPLQQDLTKIYTAMAIEKSIVAEVMLAGGECGRADLLGKSKQFADGEIVAAIQQLQFRKWVTTVSVDRVQLAPGLDQNPSFLADFFRWFLSNVIVTRSIGCAWWDAHIDTNFLREVCRIQWNIPLTEDEKILLVLRLSPSAIFYAIHPDEMIVSHRQMTPVNKPRIDSADQRQFMRRISRCLIQDYMQPQLAVYFAEIRKIRKLEYVAKFKVGSELTTVLEGQMSELIILGQMGDPWGGLWLHMAGIDDPNAETTSAPPPVVS